MSGVWMSKQNRVIQLFENPQAEQAMGLSTGRKKLLVYLPTGEVVSSYSALDRILRGLGWEKYHGGNPDFIQYHNHSSIDLITLPKDISKFSSVYMYGVVIKNPNLFHVRDF